MFYEKSQTNGSLGTLLPSRGELFSLLTWAGNLGKVRHGEEA